MTMSGNAGGEAPGAVIGLEIHVQMTSLRTKLFCSCSSDYRGKPPNTHVCPVCLGLPGALPVVNGEAVRKALMVSMALNMDLSSTVTWARKHYFYPDLPKNYQITQYDGKATQTLARGGWMDLELPGGARRRVRIRRLNIEEDPGRIVYPTGNMLTSPYVLVDYNRSGVALLEIVTEPDFRSAEEVGLFLRKLRSMLEHLEVSDFDLEGSMRVDVNISLDGGERVEVKNIGSISDAEQAIRYELARQKHILSSGGRVSRETRHWDSARKVTVPVRVKEAEEDYRYMPDPNLPPIVVDRGLLEEIRATMPELPDARRERLVREHGLSEYLAGVLVQRKALADYYEEVAGRLGQRGDRVAAFIVNDLLGWLEERESELPRVFPVDWTVEALRMFLEGRITIKMLKEMVPEMARGKRPREVVRERGWEVLSDPHVLEKVVDEVFRENPKAVEDARRNPRAVQFLVGMVLKKTGKKADPRLAYEIVRKKLEGG